MPAYDGNLFHPPAPLARVVLRNPQNKETIPGVALLIDSGADVTLIPQSALTQVGIIVDAAETYELQSFDRHISRAHSGHS
jgi:hypothetical protein